MPWAQTSFPDSNMDSTAEAGRQTRITQGIAGTVRYHRVIRSMGMVLVSALLMMQLMFLPTRSSIIDYFGKDRPWMAFPIASNPRNYGDMPFVYELSWTETGGWVSGGGAIKRSEMDAFLKGRLKMAEQYGDFLTLRLRIPADAEAVHSTQAAMSAWRAEVSHLHVAVIRPQTAKSSAGAGR
jgi:hypothetical protein